MSDITYPRPGLTIQAASLSRESSDRPYNTDVETGGVSTLEKAWPH